MDKNIEITKESIIPIPSNKEETEIQIKKTFGWAKFKKITLYSSLGMFFFFVFLLAKVPLNQYSGSILNIISKKTNIAWTAESVDISLIFGLKITFKNLQLDHTSSIRYYRGSKKYIYSLLKDGLQIKKLVIRPSIWSLIPIPWIKTPAPSGSFSMEMLDSNIQGYLNTNDFETRLNIEKLNLDKIPEIFKSTGITGIVKNLNINISLPESKASKSNGDFNITGDFLSIDLSPFPIANYLKGLDKINIGPASIKVNIDNGNLKILKLLLGQKGSDIELEINGDINLKDRMKDSKINLVLDLKNPKKKLLRIIENPLIKGFIPFYRNKNGKYSIKLKGSLKNPQIKPNKDG